ncbi:50S ribosomal protein L19e [Candidatus Woesearchaeota archaeon]|nr:50S ribosomal protein L19e [Candidatus Woesearchaeota archaeon]
MNLKIQKRLAAQVLGCSQSKIIFDNERLGDIKESITKIDIKNLVKEKAIAKKLENGPSRVRARKIATQKRKGRRTGSGSRKGKATARLDSKEDWINRIRKLRGILKELREKEVLSKEQYTTLYRQAKGGFFRSQRHLKLYINDIVNK